MTDKVTKGDFWIFFPSGLPIGVFCCKCERAVRGFRKAADFDRNVLRIRIECHGEVAVFELTEEDIWYGYSNL